MFSAVLTDTHTFTSAWKKIGFARKGSVGKRNNTSYCRNLIRHKVITSLIYSKFSYLKMCALIKL